MALLHFDGFEYGTDASLISAGIWDTGLFSNNGYTTGGHVSGRYFPPWNVGNNPRHTLASTLATGIAGQAWRNATAVTSKKIIVFFDGTSIQVQIGTDASGKWAAFNSAGTQLGSSAATGPTISVWHFIEAKVTISDAAGAVEVHVDGVQVLNLSSQDTKNTGNAYFTKVGFSEDAGDCDDCYICDTTGSAPGNTFLGPCRAVLLTPAADGNYASQFTASAGTRVSCIDETPTPNDDTDYIASGTAGHKNSATLTDLPAGYGTIFGLRLDWRAKKDDVTARTARAFLRSSSTDSAAATQGIAASYTGYAHFYEQSPFTSSAWTGTEVNALEAGVEIVS